MSAALSTAPSTAPSTVLDLDVTEDPTPDLPCRAVADDLWFSEVPAELERAKTFCVGCPLRRECLEGALERREYCGVWGGEIFDRGTVIARKRPRGRPSKAALARDAEIAAARAAAGVA